MDYISRSECNFQLYLCTFTYLIFLFSLLDIIGLVITPVCFKSTTNWETRIKNKSHSRDNFTEAQFSFNKQIYDSEIKPTVLYCISELSFNCNQLLKTAKTTQLTVHIQISERREGGHSDTWHCIKNINLKIFMIQNSIIKKH